MHQPTAAAADGPARASAHMPTEATTDKLVEISVDVPTEAAADDLANVAAAGEISKPTLLSYGRLPMTYDAALDTDVNYISEMESYRLTEELCERLWGDFRPAMSGLVRHHLNLQNRDDVVCNIAPRKHWLLGGFNVCIPITVQSPARRYQLILRHALPHKLAEHRYPGMVNEKTACEVAAYVWMQERCPDIPIPSLYGFGFSDHRRFTHEDYRSWYIRITHRLRRLIHCFPGPLNQLFLPRQVDLGSPIVFSCYTRHPTSEAAYQLPSAYLLLENVDTTDSQVLVKTWAAQRKEPERRQNLLRGLARIMLSLARVPLPYIGAFCFRDDGTIALANRPLDCTTAIFENEDTPRVIPRNRTYSSTEAYVRDLLHLHTQRFLTHPNAIYDELDCRSEMAAWVLVRSLAHGYIQPDRRDGPFLLQLSDLHPGNIFVDKEWNVTRIIDLEWICALPVERLKVPYWLTGEDIGGLRKEALKEYSVIRDMFMAIFEEEESRISAEHGLSLTALLQTSWTSGGVWFWQGLTSINGMRVLFEQHLRPRFSPILFDSEERVVSRFFSEDADNVVRNKVNAYKEYAKELKKLFANV